MNRIAMDLPLALVLTLATAAVGCSDSNKGQAELDVGITDGTESGPDLVSPYPDQGILSMCEQQCLDEKLYLCVSSVTSSACVQCLEDKHCAANPNAFGNRCTTTGKEQPTCTCAKDAHCAENLNGLRCSAEHHRCHCETDRDCLSPRRCLGVYQDTKVCQIPCQADADCVDSPDGHRCVLDLGRCVECTTAEHCLDSPDGLICDDGKCACLTDQDCLGVYSWGASCDLPTKRCGCPSSESCVINAHGPMCNLWYEKCTCEQDGQCTVPPYTKCQLPYATATYTHCQIPCQSDANCRRKSSGFLACIAEKCVACIADSDCTSDRPYCMPSSGMCVKCKSDKDCTESHAPYCLAATGECAECKTSTHCSANQFSRICQIGSNWCVECMTDADCGPDSLGIQCVSAFCFCMTDTDCTSHHTGKLCNAELGACSCLTDDDCPLGRTCSGSFLSLKVCL